MGAALNHPLKSDVPLQSIHFMGYFGVSAIIPNFLICVQVEFFSCFCPAVSLGSNNPEGLFAADPCATQWKRDLGDPCSSRRWVGLGSVCGEVTFFLESQQWSSSAGISVSWCATWIGSGARCSRTRSIRSTVCSAVADEFKGTRFWCSHMGWLIKKRGGDMWKRLVGL